MWPYNFSNYRSKCLAHLIYSIMQSLRHLIKMRRSLFLIVLLVWGRAELCGEQGTIMASEVGVNQA